MKPIILRVENFVDDVRVIVRDVDAEDPKLSIHFAITEEGLIIDVVKNGEVVGTSSETFGEIIEKLRDI